MTTIDNGAALKAAREALGLGVRELADRLRLVGNGDVVIREIERGRRDITGPIAVAVELLLAIEPVYREGWRMGMIAGHGSSFDEADWRDSDARALLEGRRL